MTEPAVQNAQAKSDRMAQKERRRHPRVPCVVGATLCDTPGADWICLVVDLSKGGARVAFWQTEEPPPEGELRLQTAKGGVLRVHASFIHAFRAGNRWLAGYRFERILSDDEFNSVVQEETAVT